MVAMLVCDQIITEANTNKKSLIGVFDNMTSAGFPMAVVRIGVYAKFADAEGDYLFRLRIVNLKDESLVGELHVQAMIADAMQYSDMALNFGGFQLPEEGKYEFQLFAGDIYLHRVTINAVKIEVPNE